MTKRTHLIVEWYGVATGFSECGTQVAPAASNLTKNRRKVTCRRCWLKSARRKRRQVQAGQEGAEK